MVTALVLLAFFAAGVVVSVAVAWGVELVRAYRAIGATASEMAEWMYVLDENGQQGRQSVGVIRAFGREEWTADRAVLLAPEGGGAEMEPVGAAPRWFVLPRPGRGNGASVRAYGWPLRCMTARMERWTEEISPQNFAMKIVWRGAWRIELPKKDLPAALPLRPIWGGLLVDSMLFGALIGSPWWVASVVRRRRRKKGLCVWCGYDVKGLRGKCPECGRG